MKIGMVSLGCSKNLVDSQKAMGFLEAMGHTFTDNPKNADCIIINTCGFIEPAKQESIDTILEMAQYKQGNCRHLVVMGCLAQRYLEQLKQELPEVDLFITIDEYRRLPEIFAKLLNTDICYNPDTVLATAPYTAYLKIADGCSNRCAFCAIPLIRGDYRSIEMEQIIAEAKKLHDLGVKELNLVAQDTSRYGIDLYGELKLADLLRELNKIDFAWIRVLYMYPDEINDRLLEAMAQCDKVVPYFDIPTQHGNDRLLKLMNRRGSVQHIREIVAKIRERFDDPVLRTTLIVGFPTETEEEFEDLMNFVQEIRWDRMGAFTYSREEDTASYDMQPQIDENVARDRLDRLMSLQEKISDENGQKFVGKTVDVLVENLDTISHRYIGRSRYHAPDDVDGHVIFTSKSTHRPGDIVRVRIIKAHVHDLYGEHEEA